jgi:hypothetical protein
MHITAAAQAHREVRLHVGVECDLVKEVAQVAQEDGAGLARAMRSGKTRRQPLEQFGNGGQADLGDTCHLTHSHGDAAQPTIERARSASFRIAK